MLERSRQLPRSLRLDYLAKLAPVCRTLFDIGCDHGYLSARLLRSGKAAQAILSDIHEGPAAKARALMADLQLEARSTVSCTSGYGQFQPAAGDLVVIAGLGSYESVAILDSRPPREGVTYLLQPAWNREVLRRYLAEQGYLWQEFYLQERGRHYAFLLAHSAGLPRTLSLLDAVLSEDLHARLSHREPLRPLDSEDNEWLRWLLELLRRKSRKYPVYGPLGDSIERLWNDYASTAGDRPSPNTPVNSGKKSGREICTSPDKSI